MKLIDTQGRRFNRALVFLLFGILPLIAACNGSNNGNGEPANETNGQANAQPAPAQISVPVVTATMQRVPSYIQSTGNLQADEASQVAPQVAGQVVATPVDVGDVVAAGAVIARLNEREPRLRLEQQQAAEQRAEATVRQAQARLGLGPNGRFDPNAVPEVRTALATYQQRQAERRLAEANAQRYANLVETGDVSRTVYEQERTQAETARAQETAARQQYETALNTARQGFQGVAAEQAALESSRAQTGLAQKALADTIIRAPFAGIISERPVTAGNYVTTASRIATVVRINPIRLLLQIPEADAAKVWVGLEVETSVAAYPDRRFMGRVTAINPQVDPTSRAVSVEARLENPTNLLRPGMFATARIIQPGGAEGVFIPREALLRDEATNSASVYVIEGDTARLRIVQAGDEQDGRVRIVSGVSPNESVAGGNLAELYDGAKVRPRQES